MITAGLVDRAIDQWETDFGSVWYQRLVGEASMSPLGHKISDIFTQVRRLSLDGPERAEGQ